MKQLILILIFSLISFAGLGQQIIWDREWIGQGFNDIFSNIAIDADTNIVVSGTSATGNGYPVHWVKYNKSGTLVWQKYGRVMQSGEQDIIAYGNSYLFAGTQKVTPPANSINLSDLGLHWLNSNGDTVQNMRYGSPLYTDNAIKILPDGRNIYVLGYSGVDNTGTAGRSLDYSLLKLSNNGANQEWFKTYGSNTIDQISNFLIKNRRGNLVMSGMSQGSVTINPVRPYFIEVDTNGVVIQDKHVIIKGSTYWSMTYRMFHNIAETADGNYILSGSVDTNNNTSENFIAKLDAAFNVMWVYYDPVHTPWHGYSKVQQLSDGSFVVLMHGDAALPGDYHIVKVSPAGQFVSRTTYNSPITGHVLTYDWEFLGDGSVVIAGRTNMAEAYIARLGNVGVPAVVSSVAEPVAKEAKLGQSYPNPAALETTIPYEVNPGVKEAELCIYEIATGRKVQALKLDVSSRQQRVNLRSLKPGVYSYTLVEGGMPVATKKMVVLK